MKQENYFKDESIFQGIKEFNTPAGMIRSEYNGHGQWKIYSECDDNFMFAGIVTLRIKTFNASCKSIYDKAWKYLF